jgi:hypothetical protein
MINEQAPSGKHEAPLHSVGFFRERLDDHPLFVFSLSLHHCLRVRVHNRINELDYILLDSTIPTVILGDFNLHSSSWSPAGWTPSTASTRLEEWLAAQTFSLLSQPGIPTHRGENGTRDSTIDLVWSNFAASIQGSFQGAHIDWAGSLGSDHALIHTIASTLIRLSQHREDRTNRFNMSISAEEWKEWEHIFVSSVPPNPAQPIACTETINTLINTIYDAFNMVCTATMKKKGNTPGFSSKWWNNDCREVATALANAQETDRTQLGRELKKVVHIAKRDWANSYISESNIWEVAVWRHRRHSSHIPALIDHTGELTYNHEQMASLLSERFFAKDKGNIPTHFLDDLPPHTSQPFAQFGKEELLDLLKQMANKSAPGISGIGWDLLKQGWPHCDDLLTNIYSACIRLGHHPIKWKEATVVVIPKLNKTDYSLAKAHRPIFLLKTMSKLMEKAVAKHFQYDIVKEGLIHTNQFGGRTHLSCLDAGLTLIHDVQVAHAAGLKAGILLFDVKGFFDNVNHMCMMARLQNMGFATELVTWAALFLADRRVKLRFNNILSEECVQPVGVPQGSPLSPVLSIAYTAPLLGKMANWNNSSLGMYVDDGLLFACTEEWDDITKLLRARYSVCVEWLTRSGLAVKADKTELLFFQKPYECNPMPAPTHLILPQPEINSYFTVQPVDMLRYLRFFINRRLKWEPHVQIMCNRAHASIKVLQVLGNSIHRLSMANWRLVLNAVCLPVMTWGCQLWYCQGGTKGLVKSLQQVQNEMVKVVTGSFHTAPRETLLQITRMLPMCHFLKKLTYTSTLRLYRLPCQSQLLQRLGPSWHPMDQVNLLLLVQRTGYGNHLTLLPEGVDQPVNSRILHPTVLEALTQRVPSWGPRVDIVAVCPWEVPNWVANLTYMGVVCPHTWKAWIRDLMISCEGWNTMIIHTAACITTCVVCDLTEVGGAAASYSVGNGPLNMHSWTIGSELTQFDADAFAIARTAETLAEYYTEEVIPPVNFFLLSNNTLALQVVKNPRSVKAHAVALHFHKALTLLTMRHRQVSYFLVWAPADDSLEGHNMAVEAAKKASWRLPPDGMDHIQSAAFQKSRPRQRAFLAWKHEFGLEHCLAQFRLCWTGDSGEGHAHREKIITEPPSTSNHPLWVAASDMEKDENGRKKCHPLYSRHTTSAAIQLAVDHMFTGSYAKRFRPADPPETLACQCRAALRTPSHLIRECLCHYQARVNTGIQSHMCTLTLEQLHSSTKKAHQLLKFISEGKVAFKLPEFLPALPVQPEPD